MNKVSASGHSNYGVLVNNDLADPLKPANVTVTGGSFNKNLGKACILSAAGVSRSTVWKPTDPRKDSTIVHILINTADVSGTKGITVINSKFNGNATSGLDVKTNGAVVLNTLEANENGAAGVDCQQ